MLKRILLRILLGLLGLIALLAISIFVILQLPLPDPLTQHEPEESLLIHHVSIVDITGDSVIENQSILIRDGRILEIDSAGSIDNDGRILDGRGKFVIPALWDMHTHMISSQAPQLNMPLYIAAGVTQVRDLGGGVELDVKNQWQAEVAEGKLLGPRIASKAAFMVYYLEDEEEALETVMEVEDKKDFIKTYNAILPDLYQVMAQKAREEGITFLGHKPRAVSALDASRAGCKSFEHARLFLYECFPGATDLQEEYRARISGEKQSNDPIVYTELRQRMVDEHDPEMFRELVEVMKENNTWYVPTHLTRKMDAYADNEAYLSDPRLKYVCLAQQYAWKQDTEGMVASDPSDAGRKAFMDFYEKGLELSKQAYDMGLPILAGTDANDTYCIPGLGLHDELLELVKGGLEPHEALITATLNPAKYYGWEADYGSVSAGKVADMILLDANPLEDIAHTQEIHTLIFDGAVYTREDLDNMLKYVEENANSLSVNAKLIKEKI